MIYDSLIVGGGIAGLQAAIQLGRYCHSVVVIDAGSGRSALCRKYGNLLGWPEGVAGEELRRLGREHAERLGVRFVADEVVRAEKTEQGFTLHLRRSPDRYSGYTLLLATGISDRFPPLTGLVSCLGRSVYVCPDCDGYETLGKKTIVMGSGNSGAAMAVTLTYWTDDLVFVNHEQKQVDSRWAKRLEDHQIERVDAPVSEVLEENGQLRGVRLASGQIIPGEKGFIAFGGNHINSAIAAQLGVERMENRHIITDARTKMTNVPNVWAAGDVGVHSEQVTIAMGEGSQAAIWMHKALLKMERGGGLRAAANRSAGGNKIKPGYPC
jgi:thioredoxin reductase